MLVSDIRHLNFGYNSSSAIFKDLTTTLNVGVTALVGVNGSGKSTLLQLLAGSLQPTSGSINLWNGEKDWPITPLQGMRSGFSALMPQDLPLPPQMRLENFLHYMAWMRGVPRSLRDDSVRTSLNQVDLSDKSDSKMGDLSGGMVRRVLLAQTLVSSPCLLLLDEPMAGLDPEQKIGFRGQVAKLADTGKSIILSSHSLEEIAPICDRVLMVDEGRVAFSGSLDDLGSMGRVESPESVGISALEVAFLRLRKKTEGGA